MDYTYKSLEAIVAGSDLIVVGHIADVYVGEQWAFNDIEAPVPLIYARIVVSDVLKGEAQSRLAGAVEILLAPGDEEVVNDLVLPAEDALWFLKSRAKERELLGRPPASSDIAPYSYFRPNMYQSVIRDIGGKGWPMFPDLIRDNYGSHEYPLELMGRPFGALIAEVREMAAL